jgi:hypothetical protein
VRTLFPSTGLLLSTALLGYGCGDGRGGFVPHPSPESTATQAPTAEPRPSPSTVASADFAYVSSGFPPPTHLAPNTLSSYQLARDTGMLVHTKDLDVQNNFLGSLVPHPDGRSLLLGQDVGPNSSPRLQVASVAADGSLADDAAFDLNGIVATRPRLAAGGRYAYAYVRTSLFTGAGTLYSIDVDKNDGNFGRMEAFDPPDSLTALVFSTRTKLLYTAQGPNASIVTYSFSPAGHGVAVGTTGGGHGTVVAVALGRDDRTLLVATRLRLDVYVIGDDGMPWLGSSTPLVLNQATDVAASPTGDYACVSTHDGVQLFAIDPSTGRSRATLEARMQIQPEALAFEPSGRFLYVSRHDGLWGFAFDSAVGSLLDLGRMGPAGGPIAFVRRPLP